MRRSAALVAGLTITLCTSARSRYDEQYRPQFHFSPAANWTNDPCGLVYAFGQFHLFFQHNPFANVWGNMSWGHAVSAGLVRWRQLPVAIAADSKAAIFTGSSVFDRRNSSGLCASPERGCIVSIYTAFSPKTATTPDRQTQSLAVSNDGLNWTKYSGDPVLDLGRSDTRDPKVFWHAQTARWIMLIVVADEKKVRLFSSHDLKHWEPLSDFGPEGAAGGVWECPDLFPLAEPGRTGSQRWILKIGLNPGHVGGGSGEQYFIGKFDGTRFHNDSKPDMIRWVDYGRDSYCELSFNNEPKPDHLHMIGWMNNWQYAGDSPTAPWRGSMTLPRRVSLAGGEDGSLRLAQQPVSELKSLRGDHFAYRGASLAELNQGLAAWPSRSQTFELEAVISRGDARLITWKLLQGKDDEIQLGFDTEKQQLFVDRSHCAACGFNPAFASRTVAPLKLRAGRWQLHVFVDRSSVEVFAQGGEIAMTNLVYPGNDSTGISLTASGGTLRDIDVKVWKLNSAWISSAK